MTVSGTSSFERFVEEHQVMVFRTLTRLVGCRERVPDLAQEVFLRLYRALPGFRGEALMSTYLYRIAVNVAQDEWKRRRREDRPLVAIAEDERGWEERLRHPAEDPEAQFARRELQANVEAELQRLSSVERTVLVLYHQEERSYQQIAEIVGLPIGTVRTHLHRGRLKIREGLKGVRGGR